MAWQDNCFSWRERLMAARQDDVFNDAKFEVEGETVTANRRILAMASPVLMACFYGSFDNVGIGDKITETRPVTARGLRAMIDFIYDEDNYSINDLLEGRQEIEGKEDLEKVMEVLLVGDKYQVLSLIAFCRNILLRHVKFTRNNVSGMVEVILKIELYLDKFPTIGLNRNDFLTAEIQILKAQLREYQNQIVDIIIFDSTKMGPRPMHPRRDFEFKIKFKVNQNALFAFDPQKQDILSREDYCVNHDEHETNASPYVRITWKPRNGPKEIALVEKISTTKFYAQSNVEITMGFILCDAYAVNNLDDEDFNLPRDGKFSNEDFELQIIEVNGLPFKEALTNEALPLNVLSFKLIERVV